MEKPNASRDVVIRLIDGVFIGVWDRIDAALPDGIPANKTGTDYAARSKLRIESYKEAIAAILPSIYNILSGEGMTVGGFKQYHEFESRVKHYVSLKTNPQKNHPDAWLRPPSSLDLATAFVDEHLSQHVTT